MVFFTYYIINIYIYYIVTEILVLEIDFDQMTK